MAVDKPLHLFSNTRALRLAYFTDQTKYVDFVATSAGGLTITPTVAAQTISLANTAALSVGGTLAITGAATFDSTLRVTGNLQGATANGYLNILGDSGATVNLRFTDAGLLMVNDTTNANMTVGLTINQGAADDEILAFKSTDVAHGVTSIAETDSYATFGKYGASAGGLLIRGLADTDATAFYFLSVAPTDNTAKTTSALGGMVISARKTSGTTVTNVGADGNLLVIQNLVTTRFIFDAEGSAHADVEWVAFDRHNDLAVIEDMEVLLAPGQIQRRFGDVVTHDRAFFEREGLLHDVREVSPGRMRGMLNTTRATMLAFGAIREVGGRTQAVEHALRYLLDNPTDRAGALRLLEA